MPEGVKENGLIVEHRIAELWRTIKDAADATAIIKEMLTDRAAEPQVDAALRETVRYCFNTIQELQRVLKAPHAEVKYE